ncbi:hypothetical protein [Streptomyces sp. CAU 1734]|uniref:hypothetical protein n=1 Tax=Streptomyces sp. CAU 1734 TaxID=3140360 RepID=UPI0032608DEF
MQTSAVPDLAHTAARPLHWLVTAAATAAVIALGGLVQPDTATAGRPGPAAGPAAAAPDPARVGLPLSCPAVGTVIVRKATGDLDGDGRPETVVAARCDAGSGTPPNGIWVLTTGRDGAPRVVATLLEPAERRTADTLTVRNGTISATLLGYSSDAVPGCCPDQREKAEWRWRDAAFIRTLAGAGRSV